MAYIGNRPSHGEFKKADSIVSSFNGTLTQFDLDVNTVNQTVGDATQLIVSLNGVIQEPGTAYTLGIGGGSVVFASAPVSTDTCHIVILGGVGGTSTVADGAVTASKLDSALKDYLEETFTADGTQTAFTLTRAVVGANTLLVTIDGIVQPSSAFTASGTTLTISEVLAATTNVRVVHMGVKAGVYVPANDSVTADMLANSINTDIAAKLPLAGGAMTGPITTNSTFDGVDVGARDGVLTTTTTTANAALPKAGGTMTGVIAGFTSTGIDDNATSTAITLDASGNVGIGTSSPAKKLDVLGEAQISYNGMDTYLYYQSTSNYTGRKTDGNMWMNVAGAQANVFGIGGVEKVRIDSSGNVLVGKTSNSFGTTGVALNPDGSNNMTRASDPPLALNRLTSDGGILGFYKDGTTVGSIGTVGSKLIIGSGETGVRFNYAGIDTIAPWNVTTNGLTDGTTSLGYSNTRFKDLYLSGGVVFNVAGGTGTSTSGTLDDYEEGTYMPTVGGSVSFGTRTYGQQTGVYTKIGNIVRFSGSIQYSGQSGTTGTMLISIPFATSSSASWQGSFTLGYQGGFTTYGGVGYTDPGRSDFFIKIDGSASGTIQGSQMPSGAHIIFGGTFQTDS